MPCSLLFYVFFFSLHFFQCQRQCNFHLHGCIYAQAQLTTERSALTELRANRRIVCSLILCLHGHRDISAQTFTHSLIHHITHIQTHSPIHTHACPCAYVCLSALCTVRGLAHIATGQPHKLHSRVPGRTSPTAILPPPLPTP